MKLLETRRRTAILKRTSSGCLKDMFSINITSGCTHGCLYCYAQGFEGRSKDGEIQLYENTPRLLYEEISSKKSIPPFVFFSTASDPFQKEEKILSCTFETMEILLKRGVSISFLTKGSIPESFISLFKKYRHLVHAVIGISSINENYVKIFEPFCASVEERMRNIENLMENGIETRARIDPIIPSVNDKLPDLEKVLKCLKERKVRSVSISFLILRPYICRRLKENLNRDIASMILEFFASQSWHKVMTSKKTKLVPRYYRIAKYGLIKKMAKAHHIKCHICGCKNPDLPWEYCEPFSYFRPPLFEYIHDNKINGLLET